MFYCLTSTKRHLTALKIALEHNANVNNVVSDTVDLQCICRSSTIVSVVSLTRMLKAWVSSELVFDLKLILFLQSNDGVPLLVKAAEDGLEEFVDDLLQAGSNPNSKHLVWSDILNSYRFFKFEK